jgi:hypothetical protein
MAAMVASYVQHKTINMKKIIIFLLLSLLLCGHATAQCTCYRVQNVQIRQPNVLELVLSNACDNQAYLNMYVISAIAPFDTLASWTKMAGFVPPNNQNYSSFLETDLAIAPEYGRYRVSITNDAGMGTNLICDSLAFSIAMSIKEAGKAGGMVIGPNPTSGKLYFAGESTYVIVRNLAGQQLGKLPSDSEIDLSKLDNGLYHLEFVDSNNRVVARKQVIKL